jgi:hypothetical protein
VPRILGHRAEEAASPRGWFDLGEFFRNFAIEGKLLELWEQEMAEAVVPMHELILIVSGSNLHVVVLSGGGQQIKGQGPAAYGLVGGGQHV